VFLDGYNDAIFLLGGSDVPFFAENLYRAWERERELELGVVGSRPWVSLNPSFPPLRLARWLSPPDTARLFRRSGRYRESPEDPLAFALQRFHTNRRAIAALGEEFGIDTYQFLQPVQGGAAGTGDGPPVDLEGFYAALLAERPEGLHAILRALDGSERPYVDATHYSDEGCRLVAKAMAGVLLGSAAPRQP
jgi:hypothetical protein